ncbi:MAG TPA: dockerin type I repeat-containing protein [Clostridia bacterium]|nr:dockerin type I repeat-containing protein [Clostridia bacterium]
MEKFLAGSDGWNPISGPDFIYGDVNGDKVVDALDFGIMKSYLLKMTSSMPSEYWQKAGDVNLDGVIDSMDFSCIKMYLLKMINTLPVSAS